MCVFFFFYAVNVDESCLAAARHLIHFLFYTVGTVDGFMGEKIKKIPFNFQSRRVTVFSRWLQVKTRLLTWVKVGLSPAPKGIFRPRLQIQRIFLFSNLLWYIKMESFEYQLTLRLVTRRTTLFLHTPLFFFLGLLCGLSYSTSKSSLICISCIVRAQMADPRDSFWWKAPESSGSISHTSLRLDLTLWTVLCTKELRCRDGFLFLTDTQPEDTSVTSSAVHQSAALPPNGSA